MSFEVSQFRNPEISKPETRNLETRNLEFFVTEKSK